MTSIVKKVALSILLILEIGFCFSQGPPITTETPVMLGLAGSGIRTFGKFIQKENAQIYVHPIGIPFNITPKFQVGGILPFKSISLSGGKRRSGLSDMALFVKYQLYKKDGKAKTFRILAKIKQSFPTGKVQPSPALGSGDYQTYIGLIIGKLSSAVGIYGDVGYNITSDKARDDFSYNFSIGVPLLPQKYPQKQINTFLEFNGKYVISPGIHSLFLSPGIQIIPGRRVLFEGSFQLPILQQPVSHNRMKYAISLGTRFLIN